MEFTVKARLWIGGQEHSAGSVLGLADALGALPFALFTGELEAVQDEEPINEDYLVALQDIWIQRKQFLQGQLVPRALFTEESLDIALKATHVMLITDKDVFLLEREKKRCEDAECGALFVTRESKKRHKAMTGHKRTYRKAEKEEVA